MHAPASEAELDDALSFPTDLVIDTFERAPGDVIVLGAGGKMGPTLARMAHAAARRLGDGRRVIAVSRFGSDGAASALERVGVETVRCDLLDRSAVARLPGVPNVIFMAGQKFGTTGAPSVTWAMNTIVPAICAERYAGSRIVAFSTGNVYPLTPAGDGGSRETDALAPVGEYAQSCVGRERVLEHYALTRGARVAIVRLNYAIDLRYGVLSDIALKVWRGEPVDVTMGYVNVIWQGDANARALACLPLAASPSVAINVAGRETLRVRELAERLGALLGKPPAIVGEESDDALLSNSAKSASLFGEPDVRVEQMLEWTAAWVRAGGRLLGKPTHFDARDGAF